MSRYTKRLAALTPPPSPTEGLTAATIDSAVAALTALVGPPPESGVCWDCDAHAEAVITWLQADLDGYPTPKPTNPDCWQTH